MKKIIALLIASALMLCLFGCGSTAAVTDTAADTETAAEEAPAEEEAAPEETAEAEEPAEEEAPAAEPVTLNVFAAASMTETLQEIEALYEAANPNVDLVLTLAGSNDLVTQIEEGAECDVFISAAPKQMNALSEEGMIDEDSRFDLLENKVTLCIADNSDCGVTDFPSLIEALQAGSILLAIGNSEVPVGGYTEKIFAYYSLDVDSVSSCLTYGSNVKEVTTAVTEGTADAGIIYATDAFSAGLTAVDTATPEMCGQVIYPAAVLAESQNADAAAAFLQYLTGEEASGVFSAVGFTPLAG